MVSRFRPFFWIKEALPGIHEVLRSERHSVRPKNIFTKVKAIHAALLKQSPRTREARHRPQEIGCGGGDGTSVVREAFHDVVEHGDAWRIDGEIPIELHVFGDKIKLQRAIAERASAQDQ